MTRIKFTDKNVDIVSLDTQSIFILQLISADYRMETPIQQRFEHKHNLRCDLLSLGEREYPDCIIRGKMIYIVPKIRYTDSVRESLLDKSLINLREMILNQSITRIALPHDLDQGYPVEYVKEKLTQYLGFINCEFILCRKKGNINAKRRIKKLSKSRNRSRSSWKLARTN